MPNYREEWFNDKEEDLPFTTGFTALLLTALIYAPFVFLSIILLNEWLKTNSFHIVQILFLSIVLWLTFLLQTMFRCKISPKWDRCAKVCVFPLYCVVREAGILSERLVETFVEVLDSFFEHLGQGLRDLFILSLGLFVLIGVFGILLFGFRQVF